MSNNLPIWGQITISVLASLLVGVAFAVAVITGNHDAITTLTGGAMVQFAAVVAFWVGSSSGSQKKDDTIARAVIPPSASSQP